MRNAALVDICETLFYSNTTFDFLDYYIKNPEYLRLRNRMKNILLLKANNIIYRIFHYDYFRAKALSYLKGMRKDVLNEMAEEFFHNFLTPRKNKIVWDKISEIENKDIPIILISGTISPIAEKVAEYMNCSEISTSLEYNNDICTGRIKKDNLRNKRKSLLQKNIYAPYSLIITDNIADYKLFKYAKEVIVICYNNKIRWRWLTKYCKQKITFYEEGNRKFTR